MKHNELYDVTIIGGGPAGLYAAFYSGLREMKTKIIEYQPELGGKLHVYPEKMIWDVGGIAPIPGAKLIDQLVEQALTFNPTVVSNEKVEKIDRDHKGIFTLHTSSGQVHYSKTVIVAIGSGILHPKKLKVDGAKRFEGINLNYTVKSLKKYKDKTVVISGGGNSAIDWAIELMPIAKQIFIVCRNNHFKSHEAQATQLQKSSAVCIFNSTITKLIGKEKIEAVELTNHKSGAVTRLQVDEVIVNHGYEQDTSLLENSPIPIERADDYFIAGSVNSETSIPGLYAAGDILVHEGKLNLIAGAFQDAANAVNKAKLFINPDAEKVAMVSSHHEMLKERSNELVIQMINE